MLPLHRAHIQLTNPLKPSILQGNRSWLRWYMVRTILHRNYLVPKYITKVCLYTSCTVIPIPEQCYWWRDVDKRWWRDYGMLVSCRTPNGCSGYRWMWTGQLMYTVLVKVRPGPSVIKHGTYTGQHACYARWVGSHYRLFHNPCLGCIMWYPTGFSIKVVTLHLIFSTLWNFKSFILERICALLQCELQRGFSLKQWETNHTQFDSM